ncbi:MAG: YitT family protein [Treponema sp.]|jgi:uncharacterized membrane-anchored protein YitT (DUF2179 family)|nr:YitT family protein [Treponema sp.]
MLNVVKNSRSPLYTVKRVLLILAGSVLLAFNLNTFVHSGGLLPGGFNGLTLLIQEICLRYGGFHPPFSIVNYTLNAVPAIICFKFIGKRFTGYSVLMIIVTGLLTDWMPAAENVPLIAGFLRLHDTLLSAVFGGILNAASTTLCLLAGATSGGTDFIAIFISERYHRDSWNYIFAGNCVILAAGGFLFSPDKALYSIIFQFVTTVTLTALYKGYQQKTMLIITNRHEEIYRLIQEKTHHGATSFRGTGEYEKTERVLLYSVVNAGEAADLINGIKKIDPEAFINVLRTEHLNGRFYRQPWD